MTLDTTCSHRGTVSKIHIKSFQNIQSKKIPTVIAIRLFFKVSPQTVVWPQQVPSLTLVPSYQGELNWAIRFNV